MPKASGVTATLEIYGLIQQYPQKAALLAAKPGSYNFFSL